MGNDMYIGNVGDCRTILCKKREITAGKKRQWQVVPLSVDHKPTNPEEKARLVKKGARLASIVEQTAVGSKSPLSLSV